MTKPIQLPNTSDKRYRTKKLPPVEKGGKVNIKLDGEKWTTLGMGISGEANDCLCIIQTQSGTLCRN